MVKSTDKCSSEKSKALKARPAPQVLSSAVKTPCAFAFFTSALRSGNSRVTEPAASNYSNLVLSEGWKLETSIGL